MENYIGNFVSVITRGDGERIEGILGDVNPENTRIEIKNARNFGSEGRRNQDPQIPPFPNLFPRIRLIANQVQRLEITFLGSEERDFPSLSHRPDRDSHNSIRMTFTLPPQSFFTTVPPFPTYQIHGDFDFEAMIPYHLWGPPQDEENA